MEQLYNDNEVKLSAPFPYFGGKSIIAEKVWKFLGYVKHYIEPFFGSGAVLLRRPDYDQQTHVETVCDADGHVANVWRSLQFAPDEVAKWCDWPVNHADLSARKKALIANEGKLIDGLLSDDKWFDPVMAGYWIWAASCWIGSGLTRVGSIPHLTNAGKGVHKLPHPMGTGKRVTDSYNTNIYDWFRRLSERLRYVRVVCGDWSRVCGGNWQDNMGTVGIFFDPPYGDPDRDTRVYHKESLTVSHDVEKWCLIRGEKKTHRIIVAGYDTEYKSLVESGWKIHKWSAGGGYGNLGGGKITSGMVNRHRECLFISPYCLREVNNEDKVIIRKQSLFGLF